MHQVKGKHVSVMQVSVLEGDGDGRTRATCFCISWRHPAAPCEGGAPVADYEIML